MREEKESEGMVEEHQVATRVGVFWPHSWEGPTPLTAAHQKNAHTQEVRFNQGPTHRQMFDGPIARIVSMPTGTQPEGLQFRASW